MPRLSRTRNAPRPRPSTPKSAEAAPAGTRAGPARARRDSGGSEDLVRIYLRDIGRIPMLTDPEFAALAVRIDALRAGDDPAALREAYQELVTANLRLVVSIAKRYTNCGIPMMDLIQVGNLGLMKAAEGFDFSRGCRLSTYASKWIHAGITRYISNQARTVRVPVNVIPMMSRLDRASREFTLRSGNTPTVADLADSTGMTMAQVRRLLRMPQYGLSLDLPLRGGESDVTLSELVQDPNVEDSRETVERDLFHDYLATALDEALDDREQEVLRLRYGLGGGDMLTQSEIGQMLSVSRQRISQIESRALRRLRAYDDDDVLKSYVN